MVRIDIEREGSTTVAFVSGRQQDGAAEELSNACDRIGGPFVLDLAELVSADATGIRLVATLQAGGAEVRGLSP